MPRIPGPEAARQIPLRGGSTGVPGSLAVAGQVGEAVAGLGQAISGVGDVLARRAARIQVEDDKTYVNEQVSNYETEILKLTNVELGTRGGAARGGGERIAKQLEDLSEKRLQNVPPHLQEELRNRFAVKNNHRYGQVLFHESGQRAVWQKDTDNLVVQTQRNNAFDNPFGLATYLGSAKNSLGDRYTEKNRSDIVAAGVDGMLKPGRDPVVAQTYFDEFKDGMTIEHQKAYEKTIKAAIKSAEDQAKLNAKKVGDDLKKQKEAWAEEDRATAGDLLQQGALGHQFIDNMRVDEKERQKYRDRANKQYDEKQAKFSNKAEAEMRSRISTDWESVTEKDIWDLVDKDVLPSTCQALVKNWKEKKAGKKPEKDARQKDLHGSIKRLRNAGLFLPTEDVEPSAVNAKLIEEETWRVLATEIDKFAATKPPPNESDWARFGERLLSPYKEKATESWFDGLKERIKKIAPLVSGPAATTQALLGTQAEEDTGINGKRQQATDILNDANEQVTEERIQWVMENKL